MEEVLALAKQGDEDAFLQLYSHHQGIIYRIKNKYYLCDFDYQDWTQEGLIVLHRCVHSFEVTEGITFGSFFKRSFENQIRSYVRKKLAYKRKSNVNTLSVEEKTAHEGGFYGHSPFYGETLDQILIQESLEECQDLLSDLERAAFFTYAVEGNQPIQEANPRMRSAYERSRRKIRFFLLEK